MAIAQVLEQREEFFWSVGCAPRLRNEIPFCGFISISGVALRIGLFMAQVKLGHECNSEKCPEKTQNSRDSWPCLAFSLRGAFFFWNLGWIPGF